RRGARGGAGRRSRFMNLAVRVSGTGPRVLLLHCDASTGAADWKRQEPLAQRWTLVVPDRPGFGDSPHVRVDFETEPQAHRPLLGDGAHLVGHSYGGVVAMFLAAAEPDRVRSLTVIEPPALGLSEDPEVVRTRDELAAIYAEQLDPFDFYTKFCAAIGERPWPRRPLPPELDAGVRALQREHVPWHARPDLDALRAAPFPILAVSGGHHPAFEAVCDTIAEATGAERATVPGRRHMVPLVGERFNETVEAFWSRALDPQASAAP